MCNITYKPSLGCLTVSGHAGDCSTGDNLICGAISALSYAIDAYCELHPKHRAVILRDDDVPIFQVVFPTQNGREALECIAAGMALIAEEHEDTINFVNGDSDET